MQRIELDGDGEKRRKEWRKPKKKVEVERYAGGITREEEYDGVKLQGMKLRNKEVVNTNMRSERNCII